KLDGVIERSLRQSKRARRKEQPRRLIAFVQDEASLVRLTDDIVGRYLALIEIERARIRGAPAELAVLLAAVIALRVVRNEKQRELLLRRVGRAAHREQQREGRELGAGVGDVSLLTIDHPAIIAEHAGAGLEAGGVAAGAGLGAGDRAHLL